MLSSLRVLLALLGFEEGAGHFHLRPLYQPFPKVPWIGPMGHLSISRM